MHKLILNILNWKHTHGLLVEHPLWNQGLMCKKRVGTRANVLKQSSENTELYFLENNPKVFAVVLLFHFFCKGALLISTTFACEPPDLLFFYELFD